MKIINAEHYLQTGDIFPFIKIGSKEIYNLLDTKFIIFICCQDISNINIDVINILKSKYHVFIIYNNKYSNNKLDNISSNIKDINYILHIPENNFNIYILNPNRKIVDVKLIKYIDDINAINFDIYKNKETHVPYLLVENVLADELIEELLQYYDKNIDKTQLHNSSSKNRLHLHPDKELEKKIDNKLSRSLFPEIKKIFNLDVNHRELYKIASYNADSNGRFHAHRDTPAPFQHRRYALSLCLNDDYTGGDFEFPEYNIKLKIKKNTALVFPGICSHKINEVTSGSRKVMITFFCNEIEGKTKNNNMYTVKSDFFKDKNISYSNIYPF